MNRPAPFSAVLAAVLAVAACAPPATVAPTVPPRPAPPAAPGGVAYALTAEDEAFLDTLQARTFRWFWETTDPETGLVPDRYPTRTFSSIAAIGFGLPAYGVGAERGFVTRAEAAERTLTTLRFLYDLPQGPEQVGVAGHRGYFYHFLEYDDGTRYRNTELSTIDTALLMAGVLFSREYFDRGGADEVAIRAYADSLYQRVEWPWHRDADETRLTMGWDPEVGYGRAVWQGYNEGMILYLLGLGSPTHALDEGVWPTWTSTYEWEDFYGYEHVNFTPLFGHQYSHLFVDFRGIQDEWMRAKSAELGAPYDYFENSRRATLSQKAYAQDNPLGWDGYGGDVWGLTASDGPSNEAYEFNGEERRFHTYWARGASADHVNDDGTIAPTAAGGSLPFAPEIALPALREMATRYPGTLWTDDYGFRDAFNPSFTFPDADVKPNSEVTGAGWFDHDYLGIDQGPILIMAENLRTGLVWETLKRSPYLVRGLERAGFRGGWLDGARPAPARSLDLPPTADAAGGAADRLLVVVLGSSTAEGVGPSDADSAWVNLFRAYLEGVDLRFEVLNLARGGYTTFHLAPAGTTASSGVRPAPDPRRNIDAALALGPDAIVVNLPSNDAAAGVDAEAQLANFAAIVGQAEAAGVPVWITTTQPRALDAEGVAVQRAVRDGILARYGDRAVDFWTGFADADGGQAARWDSGDGVHYNDAAHAVFFVRVRDAGVAEAVLAGR